LSRLQLISEDKLRRGTGYRVRLHTRDSNIDGNSGTWPQPLGPDALNNGERPNSYCCLVRLLNLLGLLSLYDDRNNRLLEFYQLVFSFHRA
jgi:hypothetical protein